MRTSNKILLGLFLTPIFLIAGLFITVRAKYANGNIVKTNSVINRWSDIYKIKETIKSVSILNQMDMQIIPSDSASIEIMKQSDSLVRFRIQDGVLFVYLDTAKMQANQNGQITIYNHVELFLPNVDSIHLVNSRVSVKNVSQQDKMSPAYNFQLTASDLTVENDPRMAITFYDRISVNAGKGSGLHVQEGTTINSLQVKLLSTEFEETGSRIGQLSIDTDSTSRIMVQGNNLRKAKIISTE
jgi:hypothetical protein